MLSVCLSVAVETELISTHHHHHPARYSKFQDGTGTAMLPNFFIRAIHALAD